MRKRSKNYHQIIQKIDSGKLYSIEEVIEIIKKTNTSKFDATVEAAINLNVNPKKPEHQIRGALVLPHGTGKTKKILVITQGEQEIKARAIGADYVGNIDLIAKIEKENWLDFDIIIATPDMMPKLAGIGKILGPKGLMPNPKTGTVTTDIKKAVEDIKKGRIEYKTDKFGILHFIIGKNNFTKNQLMENLEWIIEEVVKSKPSNLKGIYIKSITISNTMGPGIKLDISSFDK